jgi:predicted aldo/keto reductase-like oxidoreductase
MKKRRFGRTNHESTVAIFGAAAFYKISQKEADHTMELVISSGINHIDVAPSYGQAEERLGPWMDSERDRFFLGCKTMERTKTAAHDELRHSLELLRTDSFDLYQFHAVNSMAELNQITGSGGALEAVLEAREEGLIQHIGITGHGLNVPGIFLEALRRFDFDSVLFPLNFKLYGDENYRQKSIELLALCKKKDIGTMIIKSVAKGPWGDKKETNTTWYEPFTENESIRKCIHFVLSQPVTGICTAGDVTLLPNIIGACESYSEMPSLEQEELIAQARDYPSLFV